MYNIFLENYLSNIMCNNISSEYTNTQEGLVYAQGVKVIIGISQQSTWWDCRSYEELAWNITGFTQLKVTGKWVWFDLYACLASHL